MTKSLEHLLTKRHSRAEMVAFLTEQPQHFEEVVQISISTGHEAWRAAWLLWHCMQKHDERILPYLNKMIAVLPDKADGHQRQLLKLFLKMELNDEQEGRLFDASLGIWEKVSKSPSVRITAFNVLFEISNNYPELKRELEHLSEDQYTNTLSPGIKRSFEKLVGEVRVSRLEK